MIRKFLIIGLVMAALTLAPAAAMAVECTRLDTFWPKEKTKTTKSGELVWESKHMSPREYVEYLESKDSPAGRCIIATLYFEGKEYPQDFEKAAEIFLGNDIRFCTPGFIYLGTMYKHGLGVAKNPAKAVYWFRTYFAATPDPAPSSQDMAGIIKDIQSAAGVQIKADFEAAQTWLKKILEEPPEKLYQRGLGYLKTGEAGAGFPIADALLRHAAKAGHEQAAMTHARLYLDCKIGAYEQPRAYLPRFAEAGHAEAAALLGLYYTEKRLLLGRLARKWLSKALAGELPGGLRAKVEAALALIKARKEERDRRRKR